MLENFVITVGNFERAFGDVAVYQCAQGFRLIGSNRLACLADGNFQEPSPMCERVVCSAIPEIYNGKAVFEL